MRIGSILTYFGDRAVGGADADLNDSLTVTGSELAAGACGFDPEGFVAVYDSTPASP